MEDSEVFGNMIKQYRIDSTIELTGLRNKEELLLSATLDKRPVPPNELPKSEDETFEFSVRELSFGDRVNRRLDLDHAGLVVENVEPAGWGSTCRSSTGRLALKN